MADCIFCKIANGEIPTNAVYEDELMIAFNDLEPQAPVHVLAIPKRHIESLDDVSSTAGGATAGAGAVTDEALLGHIMVKIHEITAAAGIENGYRVVSNNGEDAFQTVKHLHFHILGKRKLTWPPG